MYNCVILQVCSSWVSSLDPAWSHTFMSNHRSSSILMKGSVLKLLLATFWPLLLVPMGSSSHNRDVMVYVLDITNRACPLFFSFCVVFLSLWPFQLYFIPYFLPTILCFLSFSLSSSGLVSAFVDPFNYVSHYESLPHPWYNSSWLGLKHQLTN